MKAEATGRPRTRQGRKVSVKGRGPLGMECRWVAGRQAALLSHQAQTRADGNVSGAWQGAGRARVGRACEAGGKQLQNQRAGLRWEEVARESLHGQKLREQNGDGGGWGDAPAPPWDSAGSQRLRGLRGKLGGTAQVKGPPSSSEFLITVLYQSWRKDKPFPSRPTAPTPAPRGGGGE